MEAKQIMKIFEETAYVRMGGSPEELQCAEYLSRCSGGFNRMLDLRCGAAALAVIELRAAGRNDSLEDVARRFGCSVRKLKYYVEYLGKMPDERE